MPCSTASLQPPHTSRPLDRATYGVRPACPAVDCGPGRPGPTSTLSPRRNRSQRPTDASNDRPPLGRPIADDHGASIRRPGSDHIVAYEEYHPYGTTAWQADKSGLTARAKRYRYTQKERDAWTGLSYHGARYYAPWLGRWEAADPAGMVDGPNRYAYVRGNPVSLSDLSGLAGGSDSVDGIRLGLDPEEPPPLPHSSEPFTSGDMTGENGGFLALTVAIQFAAGGRPSEYQNPLDRPDGYTLYDATLSDEARLEQVETFLLGRTESGKTRLEVMQDASKHHDIPFLLLAGVILAEQRDQSLNEDTMERTAAHAGRLVGGWSFVGNASYGLAQVRAKTAVDHDLIDPSVDDYHRIPKGEPFRHSDVVFAATALDESQELSIWAAAKYLRILADTGATHDFSTTPRLEESVSFLESGAFEEPTTRNLSALTSSEGWGPVEYGLIGGMYTKTPFNDDVLTGHALFVVTAAIDVRAYVISQRK